MGRRLENGYPVVLDGYGTMLMAGEDQVDAWHFFR
jgi:hypothetical protein